MIDNNNFHSCGVLRKLFRSLSLFLIVIILFFPVLTLNQAAAGENLPPVANLRLDENKHSSQNSVMVLDKVFFIGEDSYDPNPEDSLAYFWNFGDGETSNEVSPVHTYTIVGHYVVSLTVNDSKLSESSTMDVFVISEGRHEPVAKITALADVNDMGYYTGNIGELITFSAIDSYDPEGFPLTYAWDFGDGTNGFGETVVHKYSKDNNFKIILTVTDEEDLEKTDTIIIKIGAGPPTTIKNGDGGKNGGEDELTFFGQPFGFVVLVVGIIITVTVICIWLLLVILHRRTDRQLRIDGAAIPTPAAPSQEMAVQGQEQVQAQAQVQPPTPSQPPPSASTAPASHPTPPKPTFAHQSSQKHERAIRGARIKRLSASEARVKAEIMRERLRKERAKVDKDLKKELEDLGIDM